MNQSDLGIPQTPLIPSPAVASQPTPTVSATPVSATPVSATPDVTQDTSFWGNLGAGGLSALNEVGFGAPEALYKLIAGSDNYKALQDYKAQHQAASTIGGLVGDIGSMFIPGLDVVKGTDLAAHGTEAAIGAVKAGDALAHAAEAAKVANPFVRGAANAAIQAVPRAITQGYTTNDWGDAVRQAGTGMLLGGTLGAVGSKLGKVFGTGIPEIGNDLNKTIAATSGVTSKIERSILSSGGKLADASGLGYSLNNMDDLNASLGKIITNNKLYDEAALKAYAINTVPTKWAPFENAYDKAIKPNMWSSQVPQLSQDPAIQTALGKVSSQEQQTILGDLTKVMDNENTWAGTRQALQQENMTFRDRGQNMQDTNYNQAYANTAYALRNKVDSMADSLATAENPQLSLDSIKKDFPADQAIRMAVLRQGTTLSKEFSNGSQSMEKIVGQQIGAHLLGGVSGGLFGGESQDQGQGFNVPAALGGAVIGTIAGPTIGRATTGLANGIAGRAAALAGKALPALEPGASSVSQLLQNPVLQKIVSQGAGMAPGQLGNTTGMTGTQVPTIQGGSAAATGVTGTPTSLGAQSEQNASPQAQQAAQQDFTQRTQQALMSRLQQDYQRYFSVWNPNQTTFQQFVQQAAGISNNFSPESPITWRILVPGDVGQQNKAMETYKQYKALKTIDMGSALSMPAAGQGQGIAKLFATIPGVAPQSSKEMLENYNSLVGQLTKLGGGSKQAEKSVNETLNDIMRQNIPAEQKQKLVWAAVQRAGLDLPSLANYGFAQETQ
jgi:hypothetical protein